MAAKIIVLAVVIAGCCAKPYYFTDFPGVVFRAGRSPSIAYGFGSGFASDIGGIKHSNSIGASFQTGDAQAYGSGIGSTGNNFASGVGYAQTNPQPTYRTVYPVYSTPYNAYPYNLGYNHGYNHVANPRLRDSYGNDISSAQSFGNAGNAIAQSHNGPFGSVASAANINPYQTRHSFRNPGYGSAVSSAVSTGYGATVASSTDGFGSATSLAQSRDQQGGYNTAVSASENVGGVRASTAQTVQQNANGVQHSGATSINGPGIQASHSHSINTAAGTYY